MHGNNDGDGGDEESVDEKRNNPRAFGEIRFDINGDVFGDGFVPGEGGD